MLVLAINEHVAFIVYRSVKVTLHAVDECDITLVLSYVVSNASWSPAYDTRVFTKDKTIKVCN